MQPQNEGSAEQSVRTSETKPDAGSLSEVKAGPQVTGSPDASKQPTPLMLAAARLAPHQTLQPGAPSASSVDAACESSRAVLQPGAASASNIDAPMVRAAVSRLTASASEQPAQPRRRKKKTTQSQLVAARIMAERAAEDEARRAVAERAQEAARLASESAKEARMARERERERIQQNVREAAKGVVDAKEILKRKSLEADRARQERRRAADQLKVSKGDENENALDYACKEAAKVEMEEQKALDDVNAAQARLTDLRDQLNRFSMR